MAIDRKDDYSNVAVLTEEDLSYLPFPSPNCRPYNLHPGLFLSLTEQCFEADIQPPNYMDETLYIDYACQSTF